MSLEGMKEDLDKMLDKLRAGELGEDPVLIWWLDKATDVSVIYQQRMDKGDALVLIAALLEMFDLHPLAAMAGVSKYKLAGRLDGPLYGKQN